MIGALTLLSCSLLAQDAPAARVALLVGIGDYSKAPEFGSLRGPVNDVALVHDILVQRFGFVPADVATLVDGAATLESFLKTFDRHVLQRAGKDTQVVVYFAGHGSRVPDPSGLEADFEGRPHDSSFVLFDSRSDGRAGAFDLSDDALSALLRAVADKGAQVALLTDACYSGGLLRGHHGWPRYGPVGREAVTDAASWPGWPQGVVFADDRPGATPDRRIVHLSACSNFETANEYPFETEAGSRVHGLFTLCCVAAMRSLQPGDSFALLARRIEHAMLASPNATRQNPWIVGTREMRVLSGGFGTTPAGFGMRRTSAGRWTLEAGYLHGLAVGAELEVRALDGERVLGRIRVDRLGHVTSTVVFVSCSEGTPADPPSSDVPLRATLVSRPLAATRLSVFTADKELAKRHRTSRWADVQCDDPERGDYVFVSVPNPYLRTREGLVIWPKEEAIDGGQLDEALEGAFADEQRFLDLWRLADENLRGELSQLEVAWREPSADELARRKDDLMRAWTAITPSRDSSGGWTAAVPDAATQEAAKIGALGVLEIRNEHAERVFVSVLSLTEARTIAVVHATEPDHPMPVGGAERVRVWLEAPSARAWPLSRPMRDRYLVIATESFVAFSNVERSTDRGASNVPEPLLRAAGITRSGNAKIYPEGWGLQWVDLWITRRQECAVPPRGK